MKVKHLIILLTATLCLSVNSFAKITLPSTISGNMVIQRESTFTLWGWVNPNQEVLFKVTWDEKGIFRTVADKNGRFEIDIPTGMAGGPYGIQINAGKDELTLNNILLGDVWICSGQSNMEFTINMLGGWKGTFEKDKKNLIDYKYQNIRIFTVQKDSSSKPAESCNGRWLLPDTLTVADFSATAWFFGVELTKNAGVPVGLIVTAWGGTAAEAWTPKNIIDTDPSTVFYRSAPNAAAQWPSKPGVLYNAMINPLLKTKITGVIWYQGESNVNDAGHYRNLFTTMIKSWRSAWNSKDLPFYFVQIAPFTGYSSNSAVLREAQLQSLSLPNTGMAVTLDIAGDVNDIHPVNKQDVGKRLALWALKGKYGLKDTECSGPVYKDSKTEGKSIRISFGHADSLYIKNTGIQEFYIAGDDRLFIPAKVKTDGSSLVVWSDEVNKPVAVRYAFRNNSTGSLYNRAGLPASSFRTDTWPVVYENVTLSPVYDTLYNKLKYVLKAGKGSIRYTTAGTDPRCNSPEYKAPFEMPETGKLSARVCSDGYPADNVSEFRFTPSIALGALVSYTSKPSARYSAGGDLALADGLTGSTNYGDGHWQGFEGNDMEILLDMRKIQPVHNISLGFLNAPASWIFLPVSVSISTSDNGKKFTDLEPVKIVAEAGLAAGASRYVSEINADKLTRYLKITVKNTGVCPDGHPGQGKPAWLFIDEITVK